MRAIGQLGEYHYRSGALHREGAKPEPVDPIEAAQTHGRMVVLGAPGAGKSTLLRLLCQEAAFDLDFALPILVPSRDYATALGQSATRSLRSFGIERASQGHAGLARDLDRAVEEGRGLWLVDALDEARGWRERVAREAAQLPGRLLVTSRPGGYRQAPLEGLEHFEILPLAPEDRERFLEAWLTAVAESREDGPGWVAARLAWLQARLAEWPGLGALFGSPLMLTFLAVLGSEPELVGLPKRRAEIYQLYVDKLIESWELHRFPRTGATGEPAVVVGSLTGSRGRTALLQGLYRMGWLLHLWYYGGRSASQPTAADSASALAGWLTRHWRLAPGDAESTAEAILAFWRESGMIDTWHLAGQEFLAFRHLTFQEYAAGRGLADAWRADRERAWRFLLPRLHHYAWREPILLLASLLEPRELSRLGGRLLRGPSPYPALRRDLFLVAALSGEGARFSPRLTARAVVRLSRYLDAARWKERAALAAAYALGLVLLVLSVPGPVGLGGAGAWTLAWGAAFLSDRFPRMQAWLALPARRWAVSPEPRRVAEALGQMGEKAVKPLLRALDLGIGTSVGALERIGPPAVGALIEALSAPERSRRLEAAGVLARIRDPRSADALLCALDDEFLPVQVTAAEALGRVGEPRTLGALLDRLEAEPGEQLARLVDDALCAVDSPGARDVVVRALRSRVDRVRGAAAKSLEAIAGPQDYDLLVYALEDPFDRVRWHASMGLARLADIRAAEALAMRLGDREIVTVDRGAQEALIRIGAPAIPHLVRALARAEPRVCRNAADALARLESPEANRALLEALPLLDGDAKAEALVALRRVLGAKAQEPLLRLLGDASPRVRAATAAELGELGDPRATTPLIATLEDPDPEPRRAAATALGALGGAEAVDPLVALLDDERCWYEASRALSRIGEVAVASVAALLSRPEPVLRARAVSCLREIPGPVPLPSLVAALRDPEWEVRLGAAKALGKKGDATAVRPLGEALGDSEAGMRTAAAEALGQIGGPEAVGFLARAVKDEDARVREVAAEALGNSGEATAIEHLELGLEDESGEVQAAATRGLVRSGPRALDALARGLGKKASGTHAAWGLMRLGDPRAIPILLRRLHSAGHERRAEVAEALGVLVAEVSGAATARRVGRALGWRLTDRKEWVRAQARSALEAVARRRAVLEVGASRADDPLAAAAASQKRVWSLRVAFLTVALYLTVLGNELVTELLKEEVKQAVPGGVHAGLVVVILGGVGAACYFLLAYLEQRLGLRRREGDP